MIAHIHGAWCFA